MDRLREEVADLLLHLGWAFFGQECECGHNPFNWMARRIDGEAGWDDERDCPVGFRHKIKWHVGHRLVLAAGWLRPRS